MRLANVSFVTQRTFVPRSDHLLNYMEKKDKNVKLQDLLTVFHDIASAIEYLHSLGILLGHVSADAILVRRVSGRLEVRNKVSVSC